MFRLSNVIKYRTSGSSVTISSEVGIGGNVLLDSFVSKDGLGMSSVSVEDGLLSRYDVIVVVAFSIGSGHA
jgi:hypothetical protein